MKKQLRILYAEDSNIDRELFEIHFNDSEEKIMNEDMARDSRAFPPTNVIRVGNQSTTCIILQTARKARLSQCEQRVSI